MGQYHQTTPGHKSKYLLLFLCTVLSCLGLDMTAVLSHRGSVFFFFLMYTIYVSIE